MLQNLRYNEEESNFDESMKNMNCNEEIWCQNLLYSTPSRKIEGSSRSRIDKQKMKTSYKFCKSLQSRQIQRQQQITVGRVFLTNILTKSYKFCKIIQSLQIRRQHQIMDGEGVFACCHASQILTTKPPETSSISHNQRVGENWNGIL